MSYILEALKKSEKKRQGEQGRLTHLATQEPADQEHQPARRPLWPLLVGIALVINAVVLLFLFWPSAPQLPQNAQIPTPYQSAKIEVPAGGTAPKLDRTPASAVSPQLETAQQVLPYQGEGNSQTPLGANLATKSKTTPALIEVDGQQPALPGTVSRQQEQPQEQPRPTRVQTTQMTQTAGRESSEPQTTPVTAMELNAPPVARMNELPLSFRSQLPDMHMSVHVYTGSPQAGMIRLNETMLRPGDYLDNRLLLEEITPDGAVFSYQGQWFLLPRRH